MKWLFPLCILVLLSFTVCNAQNFQTDFNLLETHKFKSHIIEKKKRPFFFVSQKKILKYNPVSLALGGVMFGYQNIISSLISADCPYEVSCSGFSVSSIRRFGLIKGVALSADRLMRCTKSAARDIQQIDFNSNGRIIDSPEEYHFHQ